METIPIRALRLYKTVSLPQTNASRLAVATLESIQTLDEMILFAPLMRTVDPNLYVSAPNYGSLHLLAYVYTLNKNPELQDWIVQYLLYLGAQPNLPVYYQEAPSAKIDTPSVEQWLGQSGIVVNASMSPEQSALFPIYANRYEPQVPVDLYTIAVSHASEYYPYLTDIRDPYGSYTLRACIDLLNDDAYLALVQNQGATPTYFDITRAIQIWSLYKDQPVVVETVQNIIGVAVDFGARMDLYQLDAIKALDPKFAQRVETLYEAPLWRKQCRAPSKPLTHEMRQLATGLNTLPLSDQRSEVCPWFEQMYLAEPTALIEAAKKRQLQRVQSVSTPLDYLNQNPQGVCKNQALLSTDISQMPDVDFVVYQDANRAHWCFSYDMYDALLEKRVNPYTTEELPITVLEEVREKRQLIDVFQFDPATTFSESLQQLKKKESITNETTDLHKAKIESYADAYGVSPKQFDALTVEQLNKVFREYSFTGLRQPLAVATFSELLTQQLIASGGDVKSIEPILRAVQSMVVL